MQVLILLNLGLTKIIMVLHLLNEYKINDVNYFLKGLTLLQYAIQAGHEETAQILRNRGAFIPEELGPRLAALVADTKDEEAEQKSKKIKLDSPQNWAAFWEEGEAETNKRQREDDTDATAEIGSSAKHQRTMQ